MDDVNEPVQAGHEQARTTGERTTWVVSTDDADCDHPEAGLQRLGDDGRNSYLQCGACDAVLVVPDALVRSARIGR